jgi:hypothetical protein
VLQIADCESKDTHAEHVDLPLAPVGGLCHRIRQPVPDMAKATVIPAKAGIQASLILNPGFRRSDGVSDNSLPRLQEVYRRSLWTLTTCTARGFPERTEPSNSSKTVRNSEPVLCAWQQDREEGRCAPPSPTPGYPRNWRERADTYGRVVFGSRHE